MQNRTLLPPHHTLQ